MNFAFKLQVLNFTGICNAWKNNSISKRCDVCSDSSEVSISMPTKTGSEKPLVGQS